MEGIPDHHEASFFHEKASPVVLAFSASSDPDETFQKKDVRPDCSTREGG